jgi:hypothetical protein
MRDLTNFVQAVWVAKTLESKRFAFENLVNESHGTKETKKLNILRSKTLSASQLDKIASNYMLSGEGMKVK